MPLNTTEMPKTLTLTSSLVSFLTSAWLSNGHLVLNVAKAEVLPCPNLAQHEHPERLCPAAGTPTRPCHPVTLALWLHL